MTKYTAQNDAGRVDAAPGTWAADYAYRFGDVVTVQVPVTSMLRRVFVALRLAKPKTITETYRVVLTGDRTP